jgi:rubredoxin
MRKKMKTYRGDLLCPACGHVLSPDYQDEQVELPSGMFFTRRDNYVKCSNTRCPKQAKRQELPEA